MNKVTNFDFLSIRRLIYKSNTTLELSKPIELFTYSYDKENKIHPPILNRFKRLDLTQRSYSLVEGFSETGIYNETSSPMTPFLTTLLENSFNVTKVDFITYRNNLIKIFGTLVSNSPWVIDVERIADTIHLGVVILPETNLNVEVNKGIYSGFKFEDFSRENDTNLQFSSIRSTRLLNNNIILAAEIDCYQASNNSNTDSQSSSTSKIYPTDSYVELKAAKEVTDQKSDHIFRKYKLFKYWLQSYLAGVPTIVVGFRDSDFNITLVKEFKTLEIPKLSNLEWNPNKSLLFGNAVLEFLKTSTKPNKKYKLEFNNSKIQLHEIETTPDTISILSDTYKQYFQGLLKEKSTNNTEKIEPNTKKRDFEYVERELDSSNKSMKFK